MKFQDFPYERMILHPIPEELTDIAVKLETAASPEELIANYKRLDGFKSRLSTATAICYIRHTVDTRDEFYKEEQDYYDEFQPAVDEKIIGIGRKLLTSPFHRELEAEIGPLALKNIEIVSRAVGPQIVSDMQQENALVTQYQALTAGAQIDFDGKKVNLSQLIAYQESPDRTVREAACRAEGEFYAAHGETLDDIFDRLVGLRTGMAKKMGFETYTEMAYCLRCRNSYTREDVEKFRDQVVAHVVPAVTRLLEKRNRRCGIPHARYWDRKLLFEEGNPAPKDSPEVIFQNGKKMYEELSAETGTFMNFMLEQGLFDVLSKEGKADGGYCIGLPDYKAPFVFANFNKTKEDITVLTHECGHAFEAYVAMRSMNYMDQREFSPEIGEIHSMSMEHFTYPWMKLFFGEAVDKFYYSHLFGSLAFWPYGSMVDHFQHVVYDNPHLTPAERHEEWLKLERIYRPDADFADLPHYSRGGMWQQKLHIYHYPFYYIDYCLALYAAICFWIRMGENKEKAWQTYFELIQKAGTKDYITLLKEAGFETPFEENAMREAVEAMSAYLKELEEKFPVKEALPQ